MNPAMVISLLQIAMDDRRAVEERVAILEKLYAEFKAYEELVEGLLDNERAAFWQAHSN